MAEFDISTPVKFINRQGIICCALVVKAISDSRANLVWFDPTTGLQTFVEGALFSNDVAASSTFHLADTDLTPKTDEEKTQFRLNAVESSGLENTTVAPGTGQTIMPVAGVPVDQQVMPTDGKSGEKAIDAMEVPPTVPVVITDPPQQDRTGILTNEPAEDQGSVTPPVDPNPPAKQEEESHDADASA